MDLEAENTRLRRAVSGSASAICTNTEFALSRSPQMNHKTG
jgi:hypothetical protein